MVQQKNRPYQGNSTPMSEKPMSDSLRAAQVIFQKHSEHPTQPTPATPVGTTASANTNTSSTTNVRRGNSQLKPAKVAATTAKNRTVTPPPKTSNGTISSHQESPTPPSEQAHLAALLALATLNPGNDEESSHPGSNSGPVESEKAASVATKPKQPHSIPSQNLAHLYRVPSSRNGSNVNVANSRHKGSVSLDDLPRLEVSRDTSSDRKSVV